MIQKQTFYLSDLAREYKFKVEKSFIGESDNKLKNDVILHLIEKLKLELPDTFLKKWLVHTE